MLTGCNSSKYCLYLSYGPSKVPPTFMYNQRHKVSHDMGLVDPARRTSLATADLSDLLNSGNTFCNDICAAKWQHLLPHIIM